MTKTRTDTQTTLVNTCILPDDIAKKLKKHLLGRTITENYNEKIIKEKRKLSSY